MKRILISNDDGIHAPGIHALEEALEGLAELTVMAPLTEQSATSHALTLHHPLRVRELGARRFAVEGTPTDCVLLALREFFGGTPDLVVSGINHGPNMGEDVIYSGTVAAATEGAILGIPSVAFSLATRGDADYNPCRSVVRDIVQSLLATTLPHRFLLNVNIPAVPEDQIRGRRVTRLGSRMYEDDVIRKEDPRGRPYYWIGGSLAEWSTDVESDFHAIAENHVALTPILMDLTDAPRMQVLRDLGMER